MKSTTNLLLNLLCDILINRWLIFGITTIFFIFMLGIYLFLLEGYVPNFLYIIGIVTILIAVLGILLNVLINHNPTLQSEDLKVYNTAKDELLVVLIDSIIALALCLLCCGVSVTKCIPLELSFGVSNIPGIILLTITAYIFSSAAIRFGLTIVTLKLLVEESFNKSYDTKK